MTIPLVPEPPLRAAWLTLLAAPEPPPPNDAPATPAALPRAPTMAPEKAEAPPSPPRTWVTAVPKPWPDPPEIPRQRVPPDPPDPPARPLPDENAPTVVLAALGLPPPPPLHVMNAPKLDGL